MEINPSRNPTSGNTWQLANELQSQGRGNDSMLVHMTPEEVNSLQGLAMAHGGSLTVNPQTGLPEAGFLSKLLPTLLGGALAATGVGAPLAAGIVGLGYGAAKGDLMKGLSAGLGAYGGATLAGAAGLGGSISKNAFGALGSKAGIFGANMGAGTIGGLAEWNASNPSFLGRAAQTARQGLGTGILAKAAPALAATGLVSSLSGAAAADAPVRYDPAKSNTMPYAGPYTFEPRKVTYPGAGTSPKDSSEFLYFPSGPQRVLSKADLEAREAARLQQQQQLMAPAAMPNMSGMDIGFKKGGIHLKSGAFVVDARTVSEHGNGSSGKGKEYFASLGGIPLDGPGDGVSDSIPAIIDGKQEARVARDEVIMPPEAVRRIGRGNHERGVKKLYALMDKAHKARKKAGRGEDTKLRKELKA